MKLNNIKPLLILFVLFSTLIVTVLLTKPPEVVGYLPVNIELPLFVEDWHGKDMFYCQNKQCMATFIEGEIDDNMLCPKCGGILDKVSLIEKEALPSDTIIIRKVYNLENKNIFVSLVISGSRRWSIHRPQWCLPGQGYSIKTSKKINIHINDKLLLSVMLLNISKKVNTQASSIERQFIYAYWFKGNNRETPYHFKRLFWMAYDNIIRGSFSRWAYISIATELDDSPEDNLEEMKKFIAEIYPKIMRDNKNYSNKPL